MVQKPHLLLTNDDGIAASGLRHLWQALRMHFRISIVAPQQEQSGSGMAITTRQPLQLHPVHWQKTERAFSVPGTPADCVKMARYYLAEDPPDLVCAGINRGSNAGRNVFYSGTVAATMEAVIRDLPAIAFSADDEQPGFAELESYVAAITLHVLQHPLPKGTLLNVNFPRWSGKAFEGLKLTRQGLEYWSEDPSPHAHPTEGHTYYWLGSKIMEFDEHEDSDIYWLRKGYITAVPIRVHELTDHDHLSQHKSQFEALL